MWVSVAYLAALTGPIMFTRYGGGIACMWIATAVLAAYLSVLPRGRWRGVMIAAGIGSAIVTATIGLGPLGAVPFAVLNVIEAAIVAMFLQRGRVPGDTTLGTIAQVAALLGGALVASTATSIPAAAYIHFVQGAPFATTMVNWFAGHALGTISVAPIALLVLRGDVEDWWTQARAAERIEAGVIAAIVAVVSMAVFMQHAMPLLFLPLLPLTIATFRVGRVGAAVAIVILGLVAVTFTLMGDGPVALIAGDAPFRVQFLQFYLATSVFTVLPIAADRRRHIDMIQRLADSEARYKLVSEHATDVILRLDARGMVRYVSPSVETMAPGYRVDDLMGINAIELVHPDDCWAVRQIQQAAMAPGSAVQTIEYRGLMRANGGEGLWLEARVRAITGEDGDSEMVCGIRDISVRKTVERDLRQAASTDPLTGLANRRVFNEAIDGLVALSPHDAGCVAVFDIDYFKKINDLHGHDAGDRVLQRFAEVAMTVTRAGDVVGRLGGEEFGIVLAGATVAQARAVCERLREQFAASIVDAENGHPIRATVSGGVVRLHDTIDRAAALRKADAALYDAKRQGRDRMVMAA